MKLKPRAILILNGPNLNLLGTREPELYGKVTLEKLVDYLTTLGIQSGVSCIHKQYTAEHQLIEALQRYANRVSFLILNPAGFTHTSVALRDTVLAVAIPFIEVHLTNIYAREPFRRHSYFSDRALGVISGLGVSGYVYALQSAIQHLRGDTYLE